jgi:hypothetical protein
MLAATAYLVTATCLLAGCGGSRTPMLAPWCEIRVSPTSVAFGRVASGEAATQSVHVRNLGGAECVLSSIALSATSDPFFATNAPDTLTVAPGATTALTLWFRPTSARIPLQRSGELRFQSNAAHTPSVLVPLAAEIQSDCRVDLTPSAIDFGHVALGEAARRSVQVTNRGTGVCELRSVAIAAGSDPQFHLESPDLLALQPGEQTTVNLSFHATDPAKPHHRNGNLTGSSNDNAKPTFTIPLLADIDVGCDLAWSPAELSFGNVILNAKQKGYLALSNDGSDTCLVTAIALTPDSDPGFQLAANPSTITVVPGGSASINLVFSATDSAPPHLKTGTLVFDTGNRRAPSARVPLTGYVSTVCVEASRWIYVVDEGGWLSRFDPNSLRFTDIALLNCNDDWGTMSMAVDQNAVAWVLYTDGRIFKVDTTTGACEATTFKTGQHGLTTFGMGFVFDPDTGKDTLYVSDQYTLATISIPELVLTPVGPTAVDLAELSGTGDGQLWGFVSRFDLGTHFESALVRFDLATGKTLELYTYPSIPMPRSYAMKFWGGSFWIFADDSVYRVRRESPKDAEYAGDYLRGRGIVGAGVSTCAPLQE